MPTPPIPQTHDNVFAAHANFLPQWTMDYQVFLYEKKKKAYQSNPKQSLKLVGRHYIDTYIVRIDYNIKYLDHKTVVYTPKRFDFCLSFLCKEKHERFYCHK